MKKKMLVILLVAGLAVSMMACSSNSKTGTEGTQKQEVSQQTEKEEGKKEEVKNEFEAKADANGNFVVNGGFEEGDLDGWKLTNKDCDEFNLYDRTTDCHDGEKSMHFYSTKDFEVSAEQKLTGLENGTYTLSGFVQGDTAGDKNGRIYFYAVAGTEQKKADGKLAGYLAWDEVKVEGIQVTDGTLTIGIAVKNAANGWGTIDGITLVKEQ